MNALTSSQLGWLAGIIDGEGSVTMALSRKKDSGRRWYVPHVAIPNSDPAIIAEAVRLLDALGVRYHTSVSNVRKGHFGKKDVWQIVVHHFQSVASLISVIEPHLVSVKKAKAELMLRWVLSRIPKRKGGTPYSADEIQLAEDIRTLQARDRAGQIDERRSI